MISLLTGCDGAGAKLSAEEQKELIHLREEKKAWDSEKRQMTETLELNKKDKDASLETMTRLQSELTLCQEKLKTVPEDKTVTNPKK